MERPLGPLKTIIDKELGRSSVEMSERGLADKAIADSSTADRKVRQQVEQRLEECKQLKVQNQRGKTDEMASRVRDDSRRQAVKSNGVLCIGQLKLTATVCPHCKAVHESGVMECHDTMSCHVMECRKVVTSQVDSSWDGRCA